MNDLWFWSTDHKVLIAITEQTEREGRDFADVELIGQQLGLDDEQLDRSLGRLDRGGMFEGRAGFGGSWTISNVTERGLREIGAWPSQERYVDQLVAALEEAAAKEPDPVKRSKLRGALASIGEVGQKTVVEIVASYAAKMSGAA